MADHVPYVVDGLPLGALHTDVLFLMVMPLFRRLQEDGGRVDVVVVALGDLKSDSVVGPWVDISVSI